MRRSVTSWIAWGLLLVDLLLLAWTIVLEVKFTGGDEDIGFLYGGIPLVLGYGVVGALVATRHPRNAIGWLFCGIALMFAFTSFTDEFVSRGFATGSMTMVVPLAWLQSWLIIPGWSSCRWYSSCIRMGDRRRPVASAPVGDPWARRGRPRSARS